MRLYKHHNVITVVAAVQYFKFQDQHFPYN